MDEHLFDAAEFPCNPDGQKRHPFLRSFSMAALALKPVDQALVAHPPGYPPWWNAKLQMPASPSLPDMPADLLGKAVLVETVENWADYCRVGPGTPFKGDFGNINISCLENEKVEVKMRFGKVTIAQSLHSISNKEAVTVTLTEAANRSLDQWLQFVRSQMVRCLPQVDPTISPDVARYFYGLLYRGELAVRFYPFSKLQHNGQDVSITAQNLPSGATGTLDAYIGSMWVTKKDGKVKFGTPVKGVVLNLDVQPAMSCDTRKREREMVPSGVASSSSSSSSSESSNPWLASMMKAGGGAAVSMPARPPPAPAKPPAKPAMTYHKKAKWTPPQRARWPSAAAAAAEDDGAADDDDDNMP